MCSLNRTLYCLLLSLDRLPKQNRLQRVRSLIYGDESVALHRELHLTELQRRPRICYLVLRYR